MLTLIENFPDQAVRLLEYVGMTKSHEIVYHKDWNRRMLLAMDGMVVQPSSDATVSVFLFVSWNCPSICLDVF